MDDEKLVWLIIAALQLAVLASIAARIHERPNRAFWVAGGILISIGILIAVACAAWIVARAERSPMLMRGGWLGFWLSLLTAVEMIALGGWMCIRAKSRRRRHSGTLCIVTRQIGDGHALASI